MQDTKSTVLIIEDDVDFRNSLGRFLQSAGFDTQLFGSVSEFLSFNPPDGPACIVLDVRLPGQGGLSLQRGLAAANRLTPIVFITAHADIRMSVQAMKDGAIEFLTKPLREAELLEAIQLGLARDRARREDENALAVLMERFGSLSRREREVIMLVAKGRLSKQIACDIGISETTVKVHRSHAMRKMNARSLLEFAGMATKLGLVPERSQGS
jgi:FixJ family two-component response regulator